MLTLAAATILCATPSRAASERAHVVCQLRDPRIDEASGIGVGIRSKGVDYVENDSGDVNRFFALNARTCATVAVVTVPHATNVDWEDLQVAPDASGAPSVWIADIGDNRATRSEIRIYRVPEPKIDPRGSDEAVTSARPALWRLRYPDGPRDAESLAVTPRGRAYIVSKNVLGLSTVYSVPARPDANRVRELTRIATIHFTAQRGESPVGPLGSVLATSAAISPSGRLLAVRTYVYADVWRLHPHGRDDGVIAALRSSPVRVRLPAQRQGEGIAFTHGRLLVDSEGVGTAIVSVAIPGGVRDEALATSPSSSTSPSPTSPSGTSGSASQTASASPSPSRTPAIVAGRGRAGGASAIILVLLIGAAIVLFRRSRRVMGDRGRN